MKIHASDAHNNRSNHTHQAGQKGDRTESGYSPMQQEAVNLYARGWNIVPCKQGVKHPSIQWKALQWTRIDEERLLSYNWSHGICSINGLEGRHSFDIDFAHGTAPDISVLHFLLRGLGLPIDYPWVANGVHGYHVHFRTTDEDGREIRFSGHLKAAWKCPPKEGGLAFKQLELRIERSITVMPPTGGKEWAFGKMPEGEPALLDVEVVKAAYLSLVELTVPSVGDFDDEPTIIGDREAYGSKAIEGELSKLRGSSNGSRNTQLNDTAFRIQQLLVACHVGSRDAERYWIRLEEIARTLGLDHDEIIKTTESGRVGGLNKPRNAETEDEQEEDAGEAAEPRSTSPYRQVPIAELVSRPVRKYVVDGFLYEHEISQLIAFQKLGKTFLVLDMAICIATGTPWMGRRVKKGRVLMVEAEGANAFAARLDAALTAKGMAFGDVADNITFVESAVPLMNSAEVDAFIAENLPEKYGVDGYALVVLDTLSRCTAGVDENDNGKMTQAIDAADRIRRALHAKHLLAVHHMSDRTFQEGAKHRFKNANEMKGRGASSVGGAVDMVFGFFANANDTITKDTLTLGIMFAKDHEDDLEVHMRRRVAETRFVDEDGRTITSCYMEKAASPHGEDDVQIFTDNQKNVLSLIPDEGITHSEWERLALETFNMKDGTFRHVKDQLKARGLVTVTERLYKRA